MRIIAGRLGGRVFASPNNSRTHPMGDKVRGALFNALGDIEGLTVLDAFAGTGALSFEAISRGAASALAIESDKAAQAVIAENVAALSLHNVKLVRATANAWLQTSNETFDLVLLDPPYRDLQTSLLQRLAERTNAQGTLVVSWPSSQEIIAFEGFELVKNSSYAEAQLLFYQRSEA
jgi:16S rRNA (guanine966-N2)-methyltransferase